MKSTPALTELARAQLELETRLRDFFGDMRQRLASMLTCDEKDLLPRSEEFGCVARLLSIATAETGALSWLAGHVGTRVAGIAAAREEAK